VTTIQIPATVGDLRWTVLSAVRLGTGDRPAEFIAVVDCREGTPTERYATVQVFVWPDRTVAQYGHYDLTHIQAQYSLAERAGLLPGHTVEVVVVRDPDAANDITVYVDGEQRAIGAPALVTVKVHDIDPGAAGVDDEWVRNELDGAGHLSRAAAAHARSVISGYAEQHDVELPVTKPSM